MSIKNFFTRFTALTILLYISMTLFCACSPFSEKKETAPLEVLKKIEESNKTLTYGKIYYSEAQASDEEFIGEDLISALYGGGSYPEIFKEIKSFAIRLPLFPHPIEYAVFLSSSGIYTNEIAAMCSERIELVKQLMKSTGNEKGLEIANSARIYIIGRYVILSMSEDNELTLDTARKIIK